MSVEASELMGDDWTRWQGYVVNGVFPLGRHLGGSAQGGLFETKAAAPGHGQLAIKLIPASEAQAELQLPRWTRTATLSHPHLLPLRESGACQLDGVPYVYVVMEYADQTLAQLLLQRALTAEEARDMLPPMLNALGFLHDQELVHGGLKPANVLVVGDQLKLASDRIRHTADSTLGLASPSVFDPPEGRQGGPSAASDVWGLGFTLLGALTRRSLSTNTGHRNPMALPADFPPEFRDVVARCLSHDPQHRPTVKELLAWTKGQPLGPVPDTVSQPASWKRPEVQKPAAAAPPLSEPVASEVTPDAPQPVRLAVRVTKPIAWRPAILWAAVILALGGTGVRLFSGHRAPAAAETASVDLASETSATAQTGAAAVPATSSSSADRSDATPHFALHEELPVVPHSAARTIHGHVKISVRAVVDADGSVSRVTVVRKGRSRHLQQLAEQAAKKWTFPPGHVADPRLVEIQFDFSRDNTTGAAIPVH